MDKLEEYIRENREDFDKYNPSPGIWNKIKNEIRRTKSFSFRWISIAAMVMVILGISVVLQKRGYFLPEGSNQKTSFTSDPQIKETEIYYNNLVNSLYRETTPLLTGNPEIQQELVADIAHLDSICSEIKKDLKDNVANKEVVEALIQNYRLKISILEDMLVVLKETDANTGKLINYEL